MPFLCARSAPIPHPAVLTCAGPETRGSQQCSPAAVWGDPRLSSAAGRHPRVCLGQPTHTAMVPPAPFLLSLAPHAPTPPRPPPSPASHVTRQRARRHRPPSAPARAYSGAGPCLCCTDASGATRDAAPVPARPCLSTGCLRPTPRADPVHPYLSPADQRAFLRRHRPSRCAQITLQLPSCYPTHPSQLFACFFARDCPCPLSRSLLSLRLSSLCMPCVI